MRVYVASSWRNDVQPDVVEALRADGHEVYDFRHPPGGDHLGFSWAEVGGDWQSWTIGEYLDALQHPVAVAGFDSDFGAMQAADVGVLVLPAGRSAHLEAGYFVGAGKPLFVLLDGIEFSPWVGEGGIDPTLKVNPELMYRMAADVLRDLDRLRDILRTWNG